MKYTKIIAYKCRLWENQNLCWRKDKIYQKC